MVFITIVTRKNGEPIHFNEPIPKVKFIKLISCSLYNSWFNLNEESLIRINTKGECNRFRPWALHFR